MWKKSINWTGIQGWNYNIGDMVEKYQFPPERWSYGLTDDMLGKQGRLSQRGLLTKPTNLPNSEEKRPVALRERRAKFCEEVFSLRNDFRNGLLNETEYKQEANSLISKLEDNDEIYLRFLEGVEPISVDMGELGVQKANYVDLNFKDTDLTKPPIVYIPGISNDVNGTGEFALELALSSKRRIIMFTYPESPQGKVTKQFGKAVFKSSHFEAHVGFFKGAIEKVLGKDNNFDICGVSSGSIMASEISKDKYFAKRIEKINLIVPPGITGLNPFDIKKRIEMNNEALKKMDEDGSVGRLMVTNVKFLDRTKEDIKSAEWAFRFLALKMAQKYEWWKGMSEARVIVAKDDGVTYGIKNVSKLKDNPNLSLEIIDGGHEVPAVNPEKVIEKMDF